ncbi:TetR family transcriptional regulator [Endozoicomonas sp. (ex Bugula neritina AB1)]|nr:TetR family transcriptional regulator [Endozoicomonas sp. (ex Bugula neritina AB1)]
MSQLATAERILDAAEQLFAEQGFSETSLRSITSRAGVNLAAVNYHFGSKKILIQAVFARFLEPFIMRLSAALEKVEAEEQSPEAEAMLHMLVDQIMAVEARSQDELSRSMQLIGLAYNQRQGHLKKYLRDIYGKVFERFLKQLMRSCPQMPMGDMFWRVYFILGSAVFTMSGVSALQSIAENDYDIHYELEDILRKMVPFMAAGLRAPV